MRSHFLLTSPTAGFRIPFEGKIIMLEEGKAAPDFALLDDASRTVKLKDFHGHPLVLFFYPRADTPG